MASRFSLASSRTGREWRYACTEGDETIGEGVGASEVEALERLVAALRGSDAPQESVAAAELRLLARRLATPPGRDTGPEVGARAPNPPKPPASWRGLDRRRRSRIPEPTSCRACNAPVQPYVHVTIRTAFHVTFKCDRCGFVWSVEMPRS